MKTSIETKTVMLRVAGVTALTLAACGGSVEPEENASAATSPLLLQGTVFWGPSATDVVDRAFVRVETPSRAYRCFTTRCDGTFVVRRKDFPAFALPARVSVERTREPESVEPALLAMRRVEQPVEQLGATLDVHLFSTDDTAQAAKLAPTGSCAPGAMQAVVACPEDR